MKKILFFFPFFGRTGSEIMLLEFIKGLDRNLFSPYIYTFMKGELIEETPKDISIFLPYKLSSGIKNWIIRKSISKKNENYLIHQLNDIQKRIQADIWYLNTIGINPLVYEIAKKMGIPIVTHVHELSYIFEYFPSLHLKNMLTYSDYFIACSDAVNRLLANLGCKNVLKQNNFIDPEKIDHVIQHKKISKSDLGINENEFVWVISARTTYLKGVDYLLKLIEVLRDYPYRIVWIGRTEDTSFFYYLQTLLTKRFPDKVIFTGALTEDYYAYLNMADGFLMPSREESFSLATSEAAYLGLPIVCFNYGAAEEIISDKEIGTIVYSWDEAELAKTMLNVMKEKQPNHKRKININLPYTKEKQMPHFNDLIATLVSTN